MLSGTISGMGLSSAGGSGGAFAAPFPSSTVGNTRVGSCATASGGSGSGLGSGKSSTFVPLDFPEPYSARISSTEYSGPPF